MKYYKVKSKYNNYKLPKRILYVKNELFTIKECEKYNVNMSYVEEVNLNSKETYFSFGARFHPDFSYHNN